MSIEEIDRPVEKPQQPHLEPTDLLDPEGNVVLSLAEWHSLQAYVEHGLGLPTTDAALCKELKIKTPEEDAQFKKLRTEMIKAYGGVHDNCFNWRNNVYPSVVELADDIVNYARTSNSAYKILQQLSDDIGDTQFDPENKTHAKFLKLIQRLIDEAQIRENRVVEVHADIVAFREKMKENRGNLKGVKTEAAEDYAQLDKHTKEIGDSLKDLQDQLMACWKTYNKDVVILATSPIYATCCIWPLPPIPIGLIAATIVDTVYGIEMDKMKRKIDEIHKLLAAQTEEFRRDSLLKLRYDGAQQHVSQILDDIEVVLPVVQHMGGIWRSIGKDLTSVVKTLQDDRVKEDVIGRAVDFGAVADSWNTVKYKADFWRQAAFIEVAAEPLAPAAE